jgi:hypothetical protein
MSIKSNMNILLQLIVSVIMGFAYYKLMSPPTTWITWMSIVVTWLIAGASMFLSCLSVIVSRRPIPLSTLKIIRVHFPIYETTIYLILGGVTSCILFKFDHIYTSYSTIISVVFTAIFVVKYIIMTPETVDCDKDRQKFLDVILQKWQAGDFESVALHLEQCDSKEVAKLTAKIAKIHGTAEAELLQNLL